MNEIFGQVVKAMVVLAKAIAVSMAAKEAPVQKPIVSTKPKPAIGSSFDWRNLEHLPKEVKAKRTFVTSDDRVIIMEFVQDPLSESVQ